MLSTGPGALILSHCVARAHPSRPIVVYGIKGLVSGHRKVTLPVEFQKLIRPGVNAGVIAAAAKQGGMTSMIADGLTKCETGVTTVAEVGRVALEM